MTAPRGPAPLVAAVDATSLYDARTGIGRFVEELLRHTAPRDDLDVVGYAVTWRGRGELGRLLPAGARVVRGRFMAAAPLRALWKRAEHPRIERWTGAVDVVHGPNFVVPPTAAASVVTVHDLTFLHHPELCERPVLDYPVLLRRALARGTWVHTPSEFVRDEVVEHLGADPTRVVAVPLGVTPAPSADGDRGRGLAGGARYLLALGTVEPRKDLPVLVTAFDALAASDPELRLVVAGRDGWGAEALTAAVDGAAHRGRIVRLGFVGEDDRGDLLAGAAAVAVPSRYEGFGLAAAEAMAAGTPVVASAVGSHREVVADAGILVPAGDADALAGALARVLAEEATAADLSARGRERAASLTWDRTADGVVALWHAARAAGAGRPTRTT